MGVIYNLGDIIRLTWVQDQEGQWQQNQMDFKVTGSPTPADGEGAEALVNAVEAAGWGTLVELLSSVVVPRGWIVQRIGPTIGAREELGTNLEPAGTSDALPSHDAIVVRKRGPLASRTNRGRLYLAGIPEDSTNDSYLTPEYRDNVAEALDPVLTATLTNSGYSFRAVVTPGPTEGGGPVASAEIETIAVDRVIRTQRRRTPGIGI